MRVQEIDQAPVGGNVRLFGDFMEYAFVAGVMVIVGVKVVVLVANVKYCIRPDAEWLVDVHV